MSSAGVWISLLASFSAFLADLMTILPLLVMTALSSFSLRADNLDKQSDLGLMANYSAYGGFIPTVGSSAIDYELSNKSLNNVIRALYPVVFVNKLFVSFQSCLKTSFKTLK